MVHKRPLFVYFRSFQTILENRNFRLQRDSNSDRQSRNQTRWPLHHHHLVRQYSKACCRGLVVIILPLLRRSKFEPCRSQPGEFSAKLLAWECQNKQILLLATFKCVYVVDYDKKRSRKIAQSGHTDHPSFFRRKNWPKAVVVDVVCLLMNVSAAVTAAVAAATKSLNLSKVHFPSFTVTGQGPNLQNVFWL